MHFAPWDTTVGGIWFLESNLCLSDQPSFRFLWTWLQNLSQLENTSVTRTRTASGFQSLWMSILGYMKNQPYWYLFQQFSESSVLQVALLPSIPPETSGANPQLHKSWKLLLSQIYTWLLLQSCHIWKWPEFAGLHNLSVQFYPMLVGIRYSWHLFLIKQSFFFLMNRLGRSFDPSFSFENVFPFLFRKFVAFLLKEIISKMWKAL